MLGYYIKQIRKSRGLSQRELGKLASLSSAFISQIESGEVKKPSIESLRCISHALKVPLSELFAQYSDSENIKMPVTKTVEEVIRELNQSLPVSIPLYKNLNIRLPYSYYYIPKQLIIDIGGSKVTLKGIVSDVDFDSKLILKGDILICGKMIPAKGDLCLIDSDTGMGLEYCKKGSTATRWVILQAVKTLKKM